MQLAFIREVDGKTPETDDMLARRYRLSLYCALEGQTSSDDLRLDTPKKRDLPASNRYLGRVRLHIKEKMKFSGGS